MRVDRSDFVIYDPSMVEASISMETMVKRACTYKDRKIFHAYNKGIRHEVFLIKEDSRFLHGCAKNRGEEINHLCLDLDDILRKEMERLTVDIPPPVQIVYETHVPNISKYPDMVFYTVGDLMRHLKKIDKETIHTTHIIIDGTKCNYFKGEFRPDIYTSMCADCKEDVVECSEETLMRLIDAYQMQGKFKPSPEWTPNLKQITREEETMIKTDYNNIADINLAISELNTGSEQLNEAMKVKGKNPVDDNMCCTVELAIKTAWDLSPNEDGSVSRVFKDFSIRLEDVTFKNIKKIADAIYSVMRSTNETLNEKLDKIKVLKVKDF